MARSEASIWVALGAELVIAAVYVKLVFLSGPAPALASAEMAAIIGKIIVLAIVVTLAGEIAFHILRGGGDDARRDERDRLFASHGNRNAYYALTAGIAMVMAAAALGSDHSSLFGVTTAIDRFVLAHAMLALLIAAAMVKYATMLFHYRRGW
ncbi:MAG: hypothetical protein Tsb0016_24010 [Sphingomonadales bacterium]